MLIQRQVSSARAGAGLEPDSSAGAESRSRESGVSRSGTPALGTDGLFWLVTIVIIAGME